MPTDEQQEKRLKDSSWFAISEQLLNRLRGRISLIQSADERRQLVLSVLDELTRELNQQALPHLSTSDERREFVEYFLSYDLLEEFLADPAVEDVMINGLDPIFVHKTHEGLVRTDRRFASNRQLTLFVKKLIIFAGRNDIEPINDIELADIRGRVNIAFSPFGPQITITRAKADALSLLQLIENRTLTYELAGQLWLYMQGLSIRPANILIAGGPGAGKTTLLNALLCFVPKGERLVVMEDTLELNTQFLDNCSRLESSRTVSLADLVKNSLRMRPDRIIVGEVRGAEARDMMTVVNIGKYCIGTLHASTARETVMRLEHEPMNVPEALVNLVDVFIVVRRFNQGGKVWRTISDVVETAGMEQKVVLLSNVWGYDHERHEPFEISPSSVYRDRLAEQAGLTPIQIIQETARRTKLLQLMGTKPWLKDIVEMTKLCQLYVVDPAAACARLEISLADLDRGIPAPQQKKKK